MSEIKSSSILENSKHLEVYLYKAPKKNHDVLVENLRKFVPWFQKNEVRIEYYKFGSSHTMDGMMESIEKTISMSQEEDLWMELQYFKDSNHCEQVYAKMMQDKSVEPLGREFFTLITQGKTLVTGGFSRLVS